MTETAALAPFREFLAPFPPGIASEAISWVDERDGPTTVVPPDPALREFRRHPTRGLSAVSARVTDLWRTALPSRRIVWCVDSDRSSGLDDIELEAVLGRYLHIDRIVRIGGDAEQRVLIVGTLRQELIALSFTLPDGRTLAGEASKLGTLDVPIALVFMTAEQARTMSMDASVATAVRQWLDRTGAGIGVRIAAGRTAAALGDPANELAPFREVWPAVSCVRFDEPATSSVDRLDLFMRRGCLRCDSSVLLDGGSAPQGAASRPGAYMGAAPYRPQPFDLRTPCLHASDESWFEIGPVRVDGSIAAWWRDRCGPADEQIAPLVDLKRMESFFRLCRVDPEAERRYPGFRVYNWPAPAPACRIALLDGGLFEAERVRHVGVDIRQTLAGAGYRARVVGHDEFVREAQREVAARSVSPGPGGGELLAHQTQAHEYLEQLAYDAPLRADYADFLRFLPPALGDALELGSGYGALAWALSTRARRYVCLDLDTRMFRAIRRDLGQSAVIADTHCLPFRDASFDVVVANNVLEHLYDPLAGLGETRRILRSAGRLFALIPLDALNSHYELRAHYWKTDALGIERAIEAAGLRLDRLEVMDIHALGVGGAFPSCNGLVAKVEARRAAPVRALRTGEGTSRGSEPPLTCPTQGPVGATWPSRLQGRLYPSIRELVRFEQWPGRTSLVVLSSPRAASFVVPGDAEEFAWAGARVLTVGHDPETWSVPAGSVDLVYAFLSLDVRTLEAAAAVIYTALRPGGTVVAVFRHSRGLHYMARVRQYFGQVCDLAALAGPAFVRLVEDDDASDPRDYVGREELETAFRAFTERTVTACGLAPEDLGPLGEPGYPPGFWLWLARACGRFLMLKASK